MSERLPPLTALRAFDAAARHMSFARAAEELNVTAAALSFQIKSLEDHLGQQVFRRLNRAVELTDAGRALAPGAREGFDALSTAWRAAKRVGDTSTITVTAGPALTAKWLAPRLFGFVRDHPDIELNFSASLRIFDIDRDDVDVAIRFGYRPPDERHYSVAILRDWMTPMMTPDLANEVKTPDDLRSQTLIHQDDIRFLKPPMDWPAWFRAAGLKPPAMAGPHFSQADHALDAAVAGGGVVLGRAVLAAKDLEEGRLVMPFATSLTSRAHYRVLCRAGAQDKPHIKAFLDWLTSEAAALEPLRSGREIFSVEDLTA
jgi:LysR family glycine cleavage system transcriptional activator